MYNPDWRMNVHEYDPSKGAYMSEQTQTIYLVVLGVFQCLLLVRAALPLSFSSCRSCCWLCISGPTPCSGQPL